MADVTAGLFFVHPGLSFCTDDGRLLECCAPSSLKVANCAFGKVEERERVVFHNRLYLQLWWSYFYVVERPFIQNASSASGKIESE